MPLRMRRNPTSTGQPQIARPPKRHRAPIARNVPVRRAAMMASLLLGAVSGCSSLDSGASTTAAQPPSSSQPAPSSAAAPHEVPTTVVLVGDSLAEQAAPYLQVLLHGSTLVPNVFGGTAPCDWLAKDLSITALSLVVISFTGNAISPCMSDGAGGYLSGQAVVDKYRTDTVALIDRARAAGAGVLLVGQPIQADSVSGNEIVTGLNRVYVDLAGGADVDFVDAGAAVENPNGTFAVSLPCEPVEPECDPSGRNVVRNDDGLHFCPGSPPPGPCAAYSSGAFRFAEAIAAAINGG